MLGSFIQIFLQAALRIQLLLARLMLSSYIEKLLRIPFPNCHADGKPNEGQKRQQNEPIAPAPTGEIGVQIL